MKLKFISPESLKKKQMSVQEIEDRLNESIGVPAFYIGKAFKISKYAIDMHKEIVNITAIPFKNIDIKFSDIENFFENYQHIFHKKQEMKKEDVPKVEDEEEEDDEEQEKFNIPPIPEYLVEKEDMDDHILTDEELESFDADAQPHKKSGTLSKTIKSNPMRENTADKFKEEPIHAVEETEVALFATPEEVKVTINDVKNILMDTIKKVQGDAKYIPQANTVNQSVNSLINLAKLSILLMNQK